MHLEPGLVLLWVNQETCDMDKVEADREEQCLLTFSLEDYGHACLVVISELD